MIHLRVNSAEQMPFYMTQHSAGADLRAARAAVIESGQVVCVPTGVWIDRVDWSVLPAGCIPELQVRARSSLAFKFGVTLANGIGTIDADYPDEIGVLLINHGRNAFKIELGDRVAQLVLNLVQRIPQLGIGEIRTGGFGSTGKS